MPVTLKDIAERVGKSVSTVSRALGNFDDISPATRLEIQRVAREMGYEPNITARNLQQQRTNSIALILPAANILRFSDPFFGEFLSGIVEQTAGSWVNLSISTSRSQDESETYLKHIRGRRFDGFILIRIKRQDPRVDILREHNIPFVAFGRIEGDNDFPFVDDDDFYGMARVADHLVSLGHTRLGCITEPMIYTKSYHRMQGFRAGLKKHKLPYDASLVVECNFRQRSGRLGALALLDRPEPPTAIVAWNDLLALGAISAAEERGLTVGKEISVTGYDGILLAEYANPPLTTVAHPPHKLGRKVSAMLLKIINKEPVARKQVIVKPSLIIRRSTGPVQ